MTNLDQRIAALREAVEWRPISGLDGYEVSSDGDVRSSNYNAPRSAKKIPREMKSTPSTTGYLQVNIRRKCYRVHVLVAEAFHGKRPDGLVCRHLNGNRQDNRAQNLAWGTHLENAADRIPHGTTLHGEKNPNSKLSDFVVREIRSYFAGGERIKEIARRFNLHKATVADVVSGHNWKHVTEGVAPIRFHREPLPETNKGTFNGRKTECKRGHPLSGDNLRSYITKLGKPARTCRACQADSRRKWKASKVANEH